MSAPLWFERPTDRKLVKVTADREGDGWAVRLRDQNGRQISPVVYRLSYETEFLARLGQFPMQLLDEVMQAMKRDVGNRQILFFPDTLDGDPLWK